MSMTSEVSQVENLHSASLSIMNQHLIELVFKTGWQELPSQYLRLLGEEAIVKGDPDHFEFVRNRLVSSIKSIDMNRGHLIVA